MTPEQRKHAILEMECDRSYWIGEYLKAATDEEKRLAHIMGVLTRQRIIELKAGYY
jgi:hypothetical protein